MKIFELTKNFPVDECYSLTDQIRRSSRSVCANLAEAFRKRKYSKAFILKLSDSESEAAETQNWLKFAYECNYINEKDYQDFKYQYDNIIGKLVNMARNPEKWKLQLFPFNLRKRFIKHQIPRAQLQILNRKEH